MTISVTDVDTFKAFLRERAQETWDQRGIPYYLSIVATDLKKLGVDYHAFTGPLRLVEWVGKEEVPDTKFVAHPTIKAKVGLLPASADFDFSSQPAAERPAREARASGKRGTPLIKFVESLAAMPEDASADLSIPARVLIALLKH